MTIAIYRKYRPKNLSDIIGQEQVSETLKNAAKAGRVSHAYLFYGPRGCGKTTIARILAKIANCDKRATDPKFCALGEPCNECAACLEIETGRALDIMEIDAASNRGIDEIRSLKENVRTAPILLRRKVYIIDEAHQLTKEAFNALLKTLEEPPEHAMFILATTEYDKLPATIISRVQRYGLKKIPIGKIIEKLSVIAKAEGITASEEALAIIAETAEGGLRDAESLLEQAISLEKTDKDITAEEAEAMFGRAGFKKIGALTDRLISGDGAGALEALYAIDAEGHDLSRLMKDVIRHVRRVLVISYDPKMTDVFKDELTDEVMAIMKEQSKKCDVKKTLSLMRALIEAYGEMKYSPFPIIPFEVAIMTEFGK